MAVHRELVDGLARLLPLLYVLQRTPVSTLGDMLNSNIGDLGDDIIQGAILFATWSCGQVVAESKSCQPITSGGCPSSRFAQIAIIEHTRMHDRCFH
jgi:hypothetical protein